MTLRNWVRSAKRWYLGTSDRALDEAYRAALLVRAIENEHFDGQKVSAENSDYCDRVLSYFESEVKQNLKTVKVRLAEFRATRGWLTEPNRDRVLSYDTALRERAAVVIEKLNFIDEVLKTYEPPRDDSKRAVSLVKVDPEAQRPAIPPSAEQKSVRPRPTSRQSTTSQSSASSQSTTSAVGKTGAIPRSFLNTFSSVLQNIKPEARRQVLEEYEQTSRRTFTSVRFLFLLVIVPLLTHQVTKNFLVEPLVEQKLFSAQNEIIFINEDLTDEALDELDHFEKDLRFKSFVGLVPEIPETEMREKLKEKSLEIAQDYRHHSANAIANVISDFLSFLAFCGAVFFWRRDIPVLKSFIDEIIYGLSDSAKAFLIILFTDMFVGFHSPHGWEVILEGVSRHFGLPESRDFNFLFIATFPVILDTVLKYWIFRYLNRISPSAVATYKTMNE